MIQEIPRRKRIPITIIDNSPSSPELQKNAPLSPPAQQPKPKSPSGISSHNAANRGNNSPLPSKLIREIPNPSSPLSTSELVADSTASSSASFSQRSSPKAASTPATRPLRSVGGGIFKSTSSPSDLAPENPTGAHGTGGGANQTPKRRTPSTFFEFTQRWNSSPSTAEKWQIIRVRAFLEKLREFSESQFTSQYPCPPSGPYSASP